MVLSTVALLLVAPAQFQTPLSNLPTQVGFVEGMEPVEIGSYFQYKVKQKDKDTYAVNAQKVEADDDSCACIPRVHASGNPWWIDVLGRDEDGWITYQVTGLAVAEGPHQDVLDLGNRWLFPTVTVDPTLTVSQRVLVKPSSGNSMLLFEGDALKSSWKPRPAGLIKGENNTLLGAPVDLSAPFAMANMLRGALADDLVRLYGRTTLESTRLSVATLPRALRNRIESVAQMFRPTLTEEMPKETRKSLPLAKAPKEVLITTKPAVSITFVGKSASGHKVLY